jgi:hypothetical protein
MRTLVATTAVLATISANAAILHVDWQVDQTAGEFLATVDTDAGTLTWSATALWASGVEGAKAMQSGSFGSVGTNPVWTQNFVQPYLVWPTSAPENTTQLTDGGGLDTALYYNPNAGLWVALAGGTQSLAQWQVDFLASNQASFRLDDNLGNADVLSGPLQHFPEPQTYALLAGLGLLGLAAYRRLNPNA